MNLVCKDFIFQVLQSFVTNIGLVNLILRLWNKESSVQTIFSLRDRYFPIWG